MKLGLDIRTTLTQTLTPQQIQYLKLLQLPLVQLEQHIRQALDENPMLEEFSDSDIDVEIPNLKEDFTSDYDIDETHDYEQTENEFEYIPNDSIALIKDNIKKEEEGIDIFQSLYSDDSDYSKKNYGSDDDDDSEPFQIKVQTSFIEEIEQQFNFLQLSNEEKILGTHLIGNIDDDGYLRRELKEIVDEANSTIADFNFRIQKEEYEMKNNNSENKSNPALQYQLSNKSMELLEKAQKVSSKDFQLDQSVDLSSSFGSTNGKMIKILIPVKIDDAERLLEIIKELDPPGVGSRNIQECLIAQCKAMTEDRPGKTLAYKILTTGFEHFIKKHFKTLQTQFVVDEEQLKEALNFIKSLNPKPGGGDFHSEYNTVIPDFIITKDIENDELLITINDSRMPTLRLNKVYDDLKKEAKNKKFNQETRTWIRGKFEDAKFLIHAIKQRKNTMLKVMTAIASKQKDFFYHGKSALIPLIYKDIAEITKMDISTVCRIVNGKYVQTDFGTFELKFFFSEALPTDEGDDVSTTVIKQVLLEMINSENKDKPLSDEKLSKLLKSKGYNVARRTVAKYREQMKLPIARLRREM